MLPRSALFCLLLPLATAPVSAAGLVIPDEPDLPPMALTRHDVRVEIQGQGATTTVEQVFGNNTQRRLEAQYVFPIPKGAVMSRFTMQVNGRDVEGEIVRQEEARKIYQSVVKRSGDAGLLEYLGADVFRANIFPVEPGERLRITVRFHQGLAAESGLVHYLYPLRDGPKRGPTVHGEFRIEVTIKSPTPVQNVYSPSHPVIVDRSREEQVKVTYTVKDTTLMKNFHLYYGVSDEDVGLNLVTYRPRGRDPGYFMMLLSPRSRLQTESVIERDLVFVIDTSGSMEGDKIKQARNALRYCITNLNKGDRFGLVRFSTSVYPWSEELVPATEGVRQRALEWVDGLSARGGTDIAGALETALSFRRNPARPCFVIFLTDGKPTLGDTIDPQQILAGVERAVAAAGDETVRIFTWGIGYDVDAQLLDSIAAAAGGVSDYVLPEEDVAAKVTSFYNKTSHPLLTGMTLELDGDDVKLLDMHPRQVPDLYAGAQLVLLGRYTGDGDVTLRLSGRVNEETERFRYEASFPLEDAGHGFVEPLWAKRRIGYLLDSIRSRGEQKELMDEVVRLSVEYGIQTPYTSYVVLGDGTRVAAAESASNRGGNWGGREVLALRKTRSRAAGRELERTLDELTVKLGDTRGAAAGLAAARPALEEERRKHNDVARSLLYGFGKRDGKSAVETARYLKRLKEADRAGERRSLVPFRKAARTRFFAYRGMWVDERFEAGNAVTAVKFGSAAYFRLIEKHPELIDALKVAATLLYVTAPGKALVVGPSGEERVTDQQIAELFRSAAPARQSPPNP